MFSPPVAAGLMGSKDKKPTYDFDQKLKDIEGPLLLDEETKKALERGKKPGLMLAEKEEPGHIYRIEIVDAKKVDPDAVIARLKSKIGQVFNESYLADDIRQVYEMGFFDDIQPFTTALPSGAIEIVYKLFEIPTIFQVKIEGNKALTTDEIKAVVVGLENYQAASEVRLLENVKKITDFYATKGYYLADVSVKTEPTLEKDVQEREKDGLDVKVAGTEVAIDTTKVLAPDFKDVVFTIKENAKIYVERVSFLGLFHLKEDELKSSIRTHEKHLISVLTEWGNFQKEYLDIDVLILEKHLHDNGLLRGTVMPPVYALSPDRSKVFVQYRLEEGPQYRLGDITVTGDLVETSEVIYNLQKDKDPDTAVFLLSNLRSEMPDSGKVFNKSKVGEGVLAISEMYKDAGFAYVNVSPEPTFNDEDLLVDLDVQIQSGPKVFIERIEISGNESTEDQVIRREFKLDEGEQYSSSLLNLSEMAINRLGYFETVEFSNRPGSKPHLMIITVKVKEKSTGSIQAGAAYGTGGEGVILRGQVSNHNLFGRGQTLTASVNWSSYRRMFDVSFIEPYMAYVADKPLSFAFTAYNRDMNYIEFYRLSAGGDFTFGYPIGGAFTKYSRAWQKRARPKLAPYVLDFDSLWFYITYTAERVEITDATANARKWDLFQGVPRYTTAIRPAIQLDQRDNRGAPTRGYFAGFKAEFASQYFGGDGLAALENSIRKNRKPDGINSGLDYLKPTASANNFARYSTFLRLYHNLDDWFFVKGFVLKSNMELGLLNTFGQPLIFENYSLGGMASVRGYYHRSISPIARVGASYPFDPRVDLKVGGNKQVFGSLELEFPLFKVLKISGVTFFDYGNVYSQEENIFYWGAKSKESQRIKPSDPLKLYDWLGLYSSAGFGVRWDSPLGYLRFEWGFPLNRRPMGTPGMLGGDSPMSFEFNIGPSF